jgi:hypothetical protein
VIKHIDGKRAFIRFVNAFSRVKGNARGRRGLSHQFRGNFLDLRTLAFALNDQGFSLEGACKYFNAEVGKTHPEEHGKITPEYIEYCCNDVDATYSLYLQLIREYEKYHLDKAPTRLYSPASIGKDYLKMMGIEPFLNKNPNFPKEVLGNIMVTYYGGRSEVRIRKNPVQICLIDFLSMYPTMVLFQDLWKTEITDKIEYRDDTEGVREFIETTGLNGLSDPRRWKELNAICLLQPDEDIVPVSSKVGDKITYNIGVNRLTSEEPIWHAVSDVMASKLLTSKTPKIIKAIRLVPSGIQEGLNPITIVGDKKIDPRKEDLFFCHPTLFPQVPQ